MRLLRKMQEPERFSPAEQNMINYILSHKREMAELSIRELAEKTYSSPAGIFRLCQKLGLKGYNEFKLRPSPPRTAPRVSSRRWQPWK